MIEMQKEYQGKLQNKCYNLLGQPHLSYIGTM